MYNWWTHNLIKYEENNEKKKKNTILNCKNDEHKMVDQQTVNTHTQTLATKAATSMGDSIGKRKKKVKQLKKFTKSKNN